MRHLFVTNDFPPKQGGIESYLVNLCSGLDAAEVSVLAPTRHGHAAVDASLPYRVVRVPGTYLRATSSVADRIVEAAKSHGAHAVHFLQALPLGRLAARVRKETGVPVTIVVHGSGDVLVPARAPLVKRMLRQTLRSADLVLANSEFMREHAGRLTGGRSKIGVLPPSVDVRRFSLGVSGARVRERHGLGSRFVVLFVGRLVKRKGADTLLRAMPGVPRSAALVVGAGPEEPGLRRLAMELNLGPRVVFAGAVPDAELPEYYAAADAFCFPVSERLGGLDTEGFGVVFLEAAATGLPSVAGRAGGVAEAVVDGRTGIILDESSPGATAAALRTLESDPTLRARMGAAARDRAETSFASQVIGRMLEDQLAAAS